MKRPIEINSKKVITVGTMGTAKALESEFRNHGFALTRTIMSTYDFNVIDICYHL